MKLVNQTLILLFFVLVKVHSGLSQDTIRTNIIIDSLENEIFYLTTEESRPIAYFSPVFTPVCVDGTCYPIKINLYWDLGGNYLKYNLDYNEILTKVEHLPFSDFDYGLLHRVIANNKSALANFTIYELTADAESKVDGITGATRPELQGAFVPDALYTSYTLWHLARKPKLQLEEFTTKQIFHSQFFHHVLATPQLGGQVLALNYLLEQHENMAVRDVLAPIIDSTDNQLTAKCIAFIPEFELVQSRELLVSTYSKSGNAEVKKCILSRWGNEVELTALELETVANNLGSQATTFERELRLLVAYKEWTENVYFILLNKINHSTNMMRREKIKRLLYSRENDFPRKFKRQLKERK